MIKVFQGVTSSECHPFTLNTTIGVYKTIKDEHLNGLSYESKLGKSLKNSLGKFDKSKAIEEIKDVIGFYQQKDFERYDEGM